MRRPLVRGVGGVLAVGLVGAACTGSDQAIPSTTIPSEPVEFETLPPVSDVATTEANPEPPPAPPLQVSLEPAIGAIDGPIPAAVDAFGFTAPSVVDFVGLPLTDIAVSPSGRWIAINRETKICLLDPSIGSVSSNQGCVDFEGSIGRGSLAWSPDESALAFQRGSFGQDEPDIVVLDVASQSFTVVADDGVDDIGPGDFDVAPFFSEDGTLHFLRAGSDLFSFNVIEFGETPSVVDDLQAEGLPRSVRRDPVGGSIVVAAGGIGVTSIATMDLTNGTSTLVPGEIDSIQPLPFLDVSGGRALIGQNSTPAVNGIRAALIDLRGAALPQAVPSMPADSDRGVVGAGLAPDGNAIMMIIADAIDPSGHQLVVAPIVDDGSVGPLGVIATGEQFAPNNGDKRIRPLGLGEQREIIWTSDRIIFGLGPNQIVTLDLGS